MSVLSAVLFVALGRVLVPYKVPPFTLPFNIALFICLLASAGSQRLQTVPVRTPSFPPVVSGGDVELPTGMVFFEAIFRGIGQVFLADKVEARIVITVGILLCSPTSAVAAILGSLVGNAMALLVGAPAAAFAAGLYGYNISLTFTCIFGTWFCPSPMSLALATLAVSLATIVTDFVSAAFTPWAASSHDALLRLRTAFQHDPGSNAQDYACATGVNDCA